MMSPIYSSGVTTSTFIIGSSSTGPAFWTPSRKAAREAISNASTTGVDVVIGTVDQRRLDVDIGKPAMTPDVITLSMPFWTPGMYSLGTLPPTILDSNSKPTPGLAAAR